MADPNGTDTTTETKCIFSGNPSMKDVVGAQCSLFHLKMPSGNIDAYNFRLDQESGYGIVSENIPNEASGAEVRCDLSKTFGECEWGEMKSDCVVDADGSLRCTGNHFLSKPFHVHYRCGADQQTVAIDYATDDQETMTLTCVEEEGDKRCTASATKGTDTVSVPMSPDAIVCTGGAVSKLNFKPPVPLNGINPLSPLDAVSVSLHRVADMKTCTDGMSYWTPGSDECVPPSRQQ